MFRYIIKRILMMIPVLLGVSFVVYYLMDLAPGDIIAQMAPQDATPEQIEMMREELGMNGSVFERYFRYLGKLVQGDLGTSLSQKRPVMELFLERFPATVELAFGSILVAILISVPLGIAAATHHRTWLDGTSMVTAMLGVSMPSFWLGLLLIMLFALKLGWLPSGGREGFAALILPALTLGANQAVDERIALFAGGGAGFIPGGKVGIVHGVHLPLTFAFLNDANGYNVRHDLSLCEVDPRRDGLYIRGRGRRGNGRFGDAGGCRGHRRGGRGGRRGGRRFVLTRNKHILPDQKINARDEERGAQRI